MTIRFVITFCAFALIVYPSVAIAVEELNFREEVRPSLKYQVDSFLEHNFNTALSKYNIASIDLNNDGIDEHILKRKKCNTEKKQCTHIIIAEKKEQILLLSKIKARNLMISGTYSHGIKDILAFKDEINDYSFDIYMWSPSQKMYILKAE